MKERRLSGRAIYRGRASGAALVSTQPISFYGGVDLTAGTVSERAHPLEGASLAGRVLVFPTGKGSTVGSYALLRLVRTGVGPAALVMEACDTTVAVGAIIAEIPCVDRIDVRSIPSDASVVVDGEEVRILERG